MTTTKILRDDQGDELMRRERARVADICHECSAPIWPGDTVGNRSEMNSVQGRIHYVRRYYCADCANLLEDSLTTTGSMDEDAAR